MSDVANRARFGARFLSVSVTSKTEIKRATSDISLRRRIEDVIIVLYMIDNKIIRSRVRDNTFKLTSKTSNFIKLSLLNLVKDLKCLQKYINRFTA